METDEQKRKIELTSEQRTVLMIALGMALTTAETAEWKRAFYDVARTIASQKEGEGEKTNQKCSISRASITD